jgi:hypothetical protein
MSGLNSVKNFFQIGGLGLLVVLLWLVGVVLSVAIPVVIIVWVLRAMGVL